MSTAPAEAPSAAPAAKSGGSKKLIIIIAVVLILLVQLAVLYFLFGGSKKKPETTTDAVAAKEQADEGALGVLVEVPVGNTEYNCTNGKAAENTVFHVNFKVVALVVKTQEQAFKDAMKTSEARIREAIIKVGRNCNHEELHDPEASTIKRLIREDINKILRKSYVQTIVINDFSVIEH